MGSFKDIGCMGGKCPETDGIDVEDFAGYLNDSADAVVRELIKDTFSSPRTGAFLVRFLLSARRAAKKREAGERVGEHIPPFLIASITRNCNLRCAGCYDQKRACAHRADDLTANEWHSIFEQARSLGISFILLAGGEPMLRPDVLTAAASTRDILFPVFTNGTMLDGAGMELFDANRNLLPVLSVEGGEAETDERRGAGVYQKLMAAMDGLKSRGIPFGTSITVTAENLQKVSGKAFVNDLHERGARAVVYVEYVPVDGNDRLAPDEAARMELERALQELRASFGMLFLSFPGDEAALGGCLAAGRGFFHIASDGAAEPCPFAPHSDMTLRDHTLREALKSPLFQRLQEGNLLNIPHTGGCALFPKNNLLAQMAEN